MYRYKEPGLPESKMHAHSTLAMEMTSVVERSINSLPYEILYHILKIVVESDNGCENEDMRTKLFQVCTTWRDVGMNVVSNFYRRPYTDWIRMSRMQWAVSHNFTLMNTMFVGRKICFDYGLGKCSFLKRNNFGKFGKYFSECDIRVRCDTDSEDRYTGFVKFFMILIYTTTFDHLTWCNETFSFNAKGFNSKSFAQSGTNTSNSCISDSMTFNANTPDSCSSFVSKETSKGFNSKSFSQSGVNTSDSMTFNADSCSSFVSKETLNRKHFFQNLGSGLIPNCKIVDVSRHFIVIQFQASMIVLKHVLACHYDPMHIFKNVKKLFLMRNSMYILTTHLSLYYIEDLENMEFRLLSECVYDMAKNNTPQSFDILAVKRDQVWTFKGPRSKSYNVTFPQRQGPKPILFDISVTNGLFMMYRTTKKWILYDIRKGSVIPSHFGKVRDHKKFISDGLFFYHVNHNYITRL